MDYRILRFFCKAARDEEPESFTRTGDDVLKLQGSARTHEVSDLLERCSLGEWCYCWDLCVKHPEMLYRVSRDHILLEIA